MQHEAAVVLHGAAEHDRFVDDRGAQTFGQLEEEIARNGWLTVGADARVLFDLPIEERYVAAIKLLGIDPLMLASEAGHA